MGYAEVALSICQHQSCHTVEFQYHRKNGTQMQARAQVSNVLSYQQQQQQQHSLLSQASWGRLEHGFNLQHLHVRCI
jgi:carbonic anhydrase